MRRDLDALESGDFEIVVVGGGMHGAWIALRAAEAGYRVALIERDDFGAATSANSLNILHGGLRYLQHLDFARMRSSILARREFCRRFPHLVRPLRCLMPLQRAGVRSPWFLGPALMANDVISMDRNRGLAEDVALPAGRLVGRTTCRNMLEPLTDSRASSGAIWSDAVTIDSARLTLEPVIMAGRAGATIANRVEALEYLAHHNAISGLTVRDRVSGRTFEIRASVVVNATGPWAMELPASSRLPNAFLPPAWIGGLNIVLRRSLGIETAIALSAASRAADRGSILRRSTRDLFFVPWRGVTMIGTDYHRISDSHEGHAGPPASATHDFLEEIARVAPRARVAEEDVALVHWGVLPADSQDATTPSKAPVLAAGQAETGLRGLVVVIGEKLTSAPMLSIKALRSAARELGRSGDHRHRVADRESGPVQDNLSGEASPGTDRPIRERLMGRFGPQWSDVLHCAKDRPGLEFPVHPSISVLGMEIIHAIRQEMALSLEDLVLRRLGLGHTGRPDPDVLEHCAAVAATEFKWNSGETSRQVAALETLFDDRAAAHPPH